MCEIDSKTDENERQRPCKRERERETCSEETKPPLPSRISPCSLCNICFVVGVKVLGSAGKRIPDCLICSEWEILKPENGTQANLAHIRESRPHPNHHFQGKVLKPFQALPSSLGIGMVQPLQHQLRVFGLGFGVWGLATATWEPIRLYQKQIRL